MIELLFIMGIILVEVMALTVIFIFVIIRAFKNGKEWWAKRK
jgi:uncharacterized membrane protein